MTQPTAQRLNTETNTVIIDNNNKTHLLEVACFVKHSSSWHGRLWFVGDPVSVSELTGSSVQILRALGSCLHHGAALGKLVSDL